MLAHFCMHFTGFQSISESVANSPPSAFLLSLALVLNTVPTFLRLMYPPNSRRCKLKKKCGNKNKCGLCIYLSVNFKCGVIFSNVVRIWLLRMAVSVYVTNGRVRARVVQANIPVLNGVLHVIDNLLYYVYRNVIQMVTSLPNAR